MNKQTASNLFMVSPLTRCGRFYQDLLKGFVGYERAGNHLVQQAELAHAFRELHKVKELALILSNIPIKGYQAIGNYFLAVAANNKGNGDRDEAKRLFELTIDTAPDYYKVKSILSLGALAFHKRDFDSALYFYQETIKAGKLTATGLHAIKAISVISGLEGNRQKALNDLENILPVIKYAPSHIYFDLLNSYAVELGEAGRAYEARNVIKHVLASPFAHAYPEWQETAQELKEPDRSFISVPNIERKTVEIETKETHHASEPNRPGRVVAFPPMKKAPETKKPELVDSQELADMSLADKREFLLAAMRTELLSESEYNSLMFMLGLVKDGAAPHVINLEDEAVLNDLMVEWAHLIEPQELVGVLSALRDCDDDERRNNLLDNMISKVFLHSRACNITESEWRRQYERSLPKNSKA